MSKKLEQRIQALLAPADIRLNGDRAWDIKVHEPALYRRVLLHGSLGFGEAYMDGWWDCDAIDQMLTRVFDAHIEKEVKPWHMMGTAALAMLQNRQTKKRSREVGKIHYDVGNDLYERMLDKNMVYTCGYWKDVDNLDDAQIAKYDLACKKIGLKKGDRVLDIGCGWGSFAKFVAKRYGAEVVGITISKEQVRLGKETCAGLPVEIRLQDYRDVNETFDHIVSFGMFEHVGYKNYREYMEVVHRCLNEDGFFLLHTIGGNRSVYGTDPWIEKYIFKNSMLPSATQISKSIENLFVMEDWHSFGPYYDKTLMAWYKNISSKWNELGDTYDERFQRMWNFYLLSCAASFRSRKNQLWQIVLSKKGVRDGSYKRVT